jgi:hypothetical protein
MREWRVADPHTGTDAQLKESANSFANTCAAQHHEFPDAGVQDRCLAGPS